MAAHNSQVMNDFNNETGFSRQGNVFFVVSEVSLQECKQSVRDGCTVLLIFLIISNR